MSRLTRTSKPSRKKQSRFQKLWNRAEKLKKNNEKFRQQLDQLVQRIHDELLPVEQQAAADNIPLLKRLLILGQRKSLSHRQRDTLFDWVMELVSVLRDTGQVTDELEDDIARFHAYYYGIELNENSDTPLVKQLDEILRQKEIDEDDELRAEIQEEHDARIEAAVEEMLDDTLGPAPEKSDAVSLGADLFRDELVEEQQRVYDEYTAQRARLREQFVTDIKAEEEQINNPFEGFDPFGDDPWLDFDDAPEDAEEPSSTLPGKEVFTRLFRATAGVLHPDRAPDETIRKANQHHMTELLKARKQGDLMTVLQMYQQHVNKESQLSGKDEKQLIAILERQIEDLEEEQEDYAYSSALHSMAYETFYHKSRRETDEAFEEYIADTRMMGDLSLQLAGQITSLKTLMPHLKQRNRRPGFADIDLLADDIFDELFRDFQNKF